jgi:hypothetical protein
MIKKNLSKFDYKYLCMKLILYIFKTYLKNLSKFDYKYKFD